VLELFPETKLGHGPPTENGSSTTLSPDSVYAEDLEKIEKKMQELVQQTCLTLRILPATKVSRSSR